MAFVFNLINQSFSAASSWFSNIFVSTGMAEAYIALMFLILLLRFLVYPLFGSSRGSDRARSRKEDSSDE